MEQAEFGRDIAVAAERIPVIRAFGAEGVEDIAEHLTVATSTH
jgi:hypothetical protein